METSPFLEIAQAGLDQLTRLELQGRIIRQGNGYVLQKPFHAPKSTYRLFLSDKLCSSLSKTGRLRTIGRKISEDTGISVVLKSRSYILTVSNDTDMLIGDRGVVLIPSMKFGKYLLKAIVTMVSQAVPLVQVRTAPAQLAVRCGTWECVRCIRILPGIDGCVHNGQQVVLKKWKRCPCSVVIEFYGESHRKQEAEIDYNVFRSCFRYVHTKA